MGSSILWIPTASYLPIFDPHPISRALHRTQAQKDPMFGLILSSHHLEIPSKFIFELMFVGQLDGTMEHPCEQEIDAIRVYCSLPPHSHAIFSVPREDRILVDSQCTGVQWEKARKYKVWYIYNWISRGADSSERPCFHWNQNLLQTQKEGILGNTKDQGTLSRPFVTSPY